MKHLLSLFTLLAVMFAANSLFAQRDYFHETTLLAPKDASKTAFPATVLLNLAGADRKMEAGLFPAADPATIEKYLPKGGAPASTTSYALAVGQETILFDTGLGDVNWLKTLNALVPIVGNRAKPENVKLILLTHLHGDHVGGLLQENARRFSNAKVLCSKLEYDETPPQQLEKFKAAYGKDFAAFNFDDIVFENAEYKVKIKALDASGHTPGHTVFLAEFESDGAAVKKLIIGDLLHAAALQFPAPEVCARYDRDPAKAVVARKRILDFAAKEKIPVKGMHFPFPYEGEVEKNDSGGYVFRTNE